MTLLELLERARLRREMAGCGTRRRSPTGEPRPATFTPEWLRRAREGKGLAKDLTGANR